MSSRAGNLPLPALSRGAFMLNHQKMTSVVVISYVVFSLFATLLNKTLYTFSEYKFPYPLFTVLFQSIIAFILITIWSRVKPLRSPNMRIPVMRWNASVANLVAPLTIVYICVLIFNPLFLQYIEVNTYHFSNSLALFYSLLFSYLMMRTVNRQRIITTCSLMVFGTLVSSLGYLNFSLAGVFYAISWPAIFALYGIYMKRSLLTLKNDYWTLIQYNLIMSAIILMPFSFLSGEISEIFSTVWFWDEVGFWIQMIITSVIGLGVNVLMVLVLIYTSPVTFIVLAVTKTAIQALLVALLFGNRISFLNISGLIIVLASSALYSFSRYEESNS